MQCQDVRKLAVDKKISWKSFLKKCQMKLRMKCIRVFELSGRERRTLSSIACELCGQIDMQTERVVSDDRGRTKACYETQRCWEEGTFQRQRELNDACSHHPISPLRVGRGENVGYEDNCITMARRSSAKSLHFVGNLSSLHIPLVAIRSDRESLSKILVALKAFENSSVKEIISKSLLPYVMISMQGASLSDNGRDVIIGVRNDRHMEVLCDLQRALYAHLMHNCPNMIMRLRGPNLLANEPLFGVPVKSWLPYCVAVRMRNFHPHSKIRQNITRFVVYNRRESFGSMACCSLKLVNVRQRDAKDGCFKVLSSVELAKPPQEKELCSLMKSLNVASKRFEDTAQKVADNAENNGAHYLDLVADHERNQAPSVVSTISTMNAELIDWEESPVSCTEFRFCHHVLCDEKKRYSNSRA
eukprot:jgi/Bigna1/78946/fgenesh1_pg.58_\